MQRSTPALLSGCILLALGCSRAAPTKPVVVAPPKPNPVEEAATKYTNGLSNEERAEFYHIAEGSEVFPLDWLKSLEDKDTGKPYMDGLERMGFIPDPGNPDGLPVGLTAEPARGLEPLGKMVGLNCTACHCGELTHKGKAMRIDGAPNFVDTRTFFASMVESALATVEDPDKLLAFIARLRAERSDQEQAAPSKIRQAARDLVAKLRERESNLIKETISPVLKQLLEQIKKQPPANLAPQGSSAPQDFRARMLEHLPSLQKTIDATATLKGPLEKLADAAERKSAVLHTLEEFYIGARLLQSRAVYLKKLGLVGKDPRTVWGPGRVDAFGSARAFLFQEGYAPIAPVSYPHIWNFERISWLHYDGNTTSVMIRNMGQALGVGAVYDPETLASSLRPKNLDRLEHFAGKIKPPDWPQELLGKIDQERVKRGATLFTEHCGKCHPAFPADGGLAPDLLFDVKTVGTDPLRAETFAETLPSGPFKGTPFFQAVHDTMIKIRDKSYEDNQVDAAMAKAFARGRPDDWRGTGKYAGRPLVAIWATGPYLHNGSVPTLHDLLLPAKDRPTTFFVGSREYDPEKLGYATHVEGKKDNFDTSTPGNRNIGHEYGSELTVEQRKDLLEYLKAN